MNKLCLYSFNEVPETIAIRDNENNFLYEEGYIKLNGFTPNFRLQTIGIIQNLEKANLVYYPKTEEEYIRGFLYKKDVDEYFKQNPDATHYRSTFVIKIPVKDED
jgi:hypothetical protein